MAYWGTLFLASHNFSQKIFLGLDLQNALSRDSVYFRVQSQNFKYPVCRDLQTRVMSHVEE